MTFRPTPLVHAFAILLAAILSLAVTIGRVELLFAALPLLVPLMRAAAFPQVVVDALAVSLDAGPAVEGEVLALSIGTRLSVSDGSLEIRPALSPLASPARGYAGVRLVPERDGSLAWSCGVRCRGAGRLELGAVLLRHYDHAGLWIGEAQIDEQKSAPVYPRGSVAAILPSPRRAASPFGTHASQSLGNGMDYGDIRPFAVGDRVRRINWPVSLRTGHLQVNQFHDERCSDIVLLIDCFMNIGKRPDASLDHSLRAATSLALGYLRHHDRVGLMAFGGWLQWTRAASGPAQHEILRQAMTRVAVSPSALVRDLTALPETMLPRHALIIALTPLTDGRFVRTLCRLGDQDRDVVAVAIRSDRLSHALLGGRRTSPLAKRLWMLERAALLEELRRHGVRAASWSPDEPIERALGTVATPNRSGNARWSA